MIERIVSHTAGRFTGCRSCGTEPRHVCATGRTSKEPMQLLAARVRHSIECRCGARTARHDSLSAAESEWGADYAQLPLALHVRRRKTA